MTEMMKAARLHEFGGPDVLRYEDAPRPIAGAGEVLVRVHAEASIRRTVSARRLSFAAAGMAPGRGFPLILGTDISGIVAAWAMA